MIYLIICFLLNKFLIFILFCLNNLININVFSFPLFLYFQYTFFFLFCLFTSIMMSKITQQQYHIFPVFTSTSLMFHILTRSPAMCLHQRRTSSVCLTLTINPTRVVHVARTTRARKERPSESFELFGISNIFWYQKIHMFNLGMKKWNFSSYILSLVWKHNSNNFFVYDKFQSFPLLHFELKNKKGASGGVWAFFFFFRLHLQIDENFFLWNSLNSIQIILRVECTH